jgi:uncharacterized cupredoxin-like copper-binding protein
MIARRSAGLLLLAALTAVAADCGAGLGNDTCEGYQDGISGGAYALQLKVTDDAFAPLILKAQDVSTVTLTLTNEGTQLHDLVIDCMPTPNGSECPATSCFSEGAEIGPLAPGSSATTTFVTPKPEGIYVFHCDLPGHTHAGQFIVQ